MDRFLALRSFTEVVAAGSFVGAAEQLGLSKAAVSRHVAELEAHLGVRLLHRTTRKLSLTAEGEVFHARSRQLLADLEEAEAELTSRSREAVGQLRVSAPVSFGILHLAPVWGAFRQKQPKVMLPLAEAGNGGTSGQFRGGEKQQNECSRRQSCSEKCASSPAGVTCGSLKK